MLVLFIVGASIVGYAYHHALRNVDVDSDGSDSVRLPQLRSLSHSIGQRSSAPEIVGRMSVYLRKPINHGPRRLMERLRVPVARYNRRHFRILV